MNGGGVAGFVRMPPLQFFAFSQAAVGTASRQPFYLPDIIPGQCNAMRIGKMAIFIHQATTLFNIQIIAGNADIFYLARIFIFKLLQTAETAMITQAFPFSRGQLIYIFIIQTSMS